MKESNFNADNRELHANTRRYKSNLRLLAFDWRKFAFTIFFIFMFSISVYAEENTPILTLEECLRQALANNPTLQQAVSNVNINKSRLGESRSDYLPKVSTSASYVHATDTAGLVAGGTIAAKGDTYIAQTTLEQLIWDFGKTLNKIKLAKENLSAAHYAFLDARENTILNTKKAYFEVLKNQLLGEVAEENLSRARIHQEQIQGFYEVGLKQKLDLTKEEVKVSQANLDCRRSRKNYEVAKVYLNNIMGREKNTNYKVAEVQEVNLIEVNLSQAVDIAVKNRNEILKKETQLKAAQSDLEVKKKGNWPKLTTDATYGATDTSTSAAVDTLNVGVLLKWPWFDSFKTKSQIKEASENLKIARLELQSKVLDVVLEVEEAVFTLEEAEEKIKASAKQLEESGQNLELIKAKYEVGLISAVELNDAEIAFISSKKSHIVSLADYLIARAAYEKAVGLTEQDMVK